jgi:hypothetical protein
MKNETKLQRLMDEHHQLVADGACSKDLAVLEKKIWEATGRKDNKEKRRRIWFRETFGNSSYVYEIRWFIYRHKWAHPLFDEVDSERMTLRQALSVFRRVNFLVRRHNAGPAKVLKSVMEQYDGTTESINRATMEGAVSIDTSDSRDPVNQLARVFRKNVQHAAEIYVTKALKKMSVEQEEQEKLIEDFVINVDEVVSELMASVHQQRRNAKEEGLVRIGRRRFTWACEVLGIQTTFGGEVDLKLVGRMVRQRARDLHPDRNKNPQAKEEYDNVNRAKEILMQYSVFSKKGNGNGNTKKESTQSS